MYGVCCKTPLSRTHDSLSELVTIRRHITCCIESLHTRLLSFIDNKTSFWIFLRTESIDKLRIWFVSNGDEYPIEGKCRSIFAENRLHSHHISLYLSHFCEVVEYDIRVLLRLFYPDILSSDFVSSDEDVDFTSDLSQIESLSDRRITATYDSD